MASFLHPRPRMSRRDARTRGGCRMKGTVARMVVDRGFGFIRGDDDREYFFHRGALHGARFEELAPGSPVVVQRGEDPGDEPDEGPRAVSVALAAGAEPSVDPATELGA